MSTFSLFSFAFEDEDLETAEDTPVSEVENDTNDVVDEAEEVGDDAEELSAVIENAIDNVEELEDVTDMMKDTVADGGDGMDDVAAEYAEESIARIYRSLNLKRRPLPAIESFKSTKSRRQATVFAIEEAENNQKTIWDKIKNFFNNLKEKISIYFTKLRDAQKAVVKAADFYIKQAGSLEGEPGEEITKGPVLASFGHEVDRVSFAAAKKINDNIVSFSNFGIKVLNDYQRVMAEMKNAINDSSMTETDYKKHQKTYNDLTDKTVKSLKSLPLKPVSYKESGGVANYRLSGFIGGQTILFGVVAWDGFYYWSFKEGPRSDASVASAADVLTADQMKTLCEEAKSLIEKIGEFEAANKALVDSFSFVNNNLKFFKKDEGDDREDYTGFNKDLAQFTLYKIIAAGLFTTVRHAPSFALATANANLKYVTTSLSRYGKKAPAAPSEETSNEE